LVLWKSEIWFAVEQKKVEKSAIKNILDSVILWAKSYKKRSDNDEIKLVKRRMWYDQQQQQQQKMQMQQQKAKDEGF
jgi:hypothetical protein